MLFNPLVRCSGNVLFLLRAKSIRRHSPFPLIGPVDNRKKALDSPQDALHIPVIRQRVRLGWQVDEKEKPYFDA